MKSLHSKCHSLRQLEAEQISSWAGEQWKNSAMLPVSYSSFICATTILINRNVSSRSTFSMKGTNTDPTSGKTTLILAALGNLVVGFFYSTVQSKRMLLLVWLHNQICSASSSLTSHSTVSLCAGHMTKRVRRKGRESGTEKKRFWGQHRVSKREKNKMEGERDLRILLLDSRFRWRKVSEGEIVSRKQ